jgi:amino acid adenylation domain-containing protein
MSVDEPIDIATRPQPSRDALARLTPQQRELLQRRLAARGVVPTAIGRREPGHDVMSGAQLRLLMLHEASENPTAYNVAQAFRLRGPLDRGALRCALDELVRRHEVLRTRYLVAAPAGRIDIVAARPVELEVAEVDDVSEFVHDRVRRSFRLDGGILLRAHLGIVGPDDHVLVIATHHIASDAISKQVLNRELSDLYSAYRAGESSPLGEPVLQYADYAAWLDTHEAASDDLDWWISHLAGAPDETDLPIDRPRSAAGTDAGEKYLQRLDRSLTAGLKAVAHKQRATLFMVLLAGLSALLERYGGQDTVVIGSPTSGRHREELQQVVGLFLNTLPLRVDTSGNPSFEELIDRARGSASGGFRHQQVPFDRIVAAIQPSRVAGRNPIFQVMLTFKEGAEATVPQLADLSVSPIGYEGGWTKFDLGLVCYPVDDELAVMWQFSSALFDRSTIEQLAAHFDGLLRAAIADPTVGIESLPLANANDRELLQQLNDTDAPVPLGCVHDLIAEQTRRTPDAPAVGDETGWLTYSELDRAANRLGNHLVSLGVGPDSLVGLCLGRSTRLEIALLAVLKAGGAYVPLDPSYPPERLAFMLEDGDPVVVLTDTATCTLVPEHPNTINIDTVDLAGYNDLPPVTAVTPSNLAYVIYTSGSTGRPKGVMVEHGAIVNRLAWMQERFGLDASDTVLQKTPLSFDVSVWEVLWPLQTGARLFMARPDGHRDVDYLTDVIERESVTVMHFVPSMLSAFLATTRPAQLGSLRAVVCSGEALPAEVQDRFIALVPAAQLHNLYGPTEAAVDVTAVQCRAGQPVSIGIPMPNCQALVLDSGFNNQPIGMPGELWLGGAQLARGYLNRDALTAERFVDAPQGRLYRTGDRAVWRPDCNLYYLGRLDGQVKLRGMRIELGEIEAVLGSHPDVSACGVVVADSPGGGSLAAYYTSSDPDAGDALDAALRDLARRQLPEHMVPTVITRLTELPLSPAGKLDRRQLAARPLARGSTVAVLPRTPIERKLAGIWQSTLELDEPPSVEDSFFELGGHSLMALALFPEIEREFGVKLPLAMLFSHLTVASLAEAIEAERERRQAWDQIVVMRATGTKRPLFFMPELRGDVLTYLQLLGSLDPDRPVYGVQCVGLDGRSAPRLTIEETAADCVDAMRQVQQSGPYLIAGYCFGGVVAYAVAAQLRALGEELDFVGVVDATPFGRGRSARTIPTPTLRERFTVRSRAELTRKVTFVREVTGYRVNLTASMGFTRAGMRIPPRFVDVRAANMRASARYVTPDSDVSIVLFRASTGSAEADENRRRRWAEVAHGGVEMHIMAGEALDHYEVIKAEHAVRLGDAINRRLADLP